MNLKINRVIAYVDGFNLYFGMVDGGYAYCKWLDINMLIKSSLSANQQLAGIKYFTSRVTNDPGKQRRQTLYLEAIESTGVKIIYGLYKAKDIECNNCGHVWQISNEKMTDVNIATHLLIDAFQDKYDTAILISGDSDLVPPIKSVHNNFPSKAVSVFFPPSRHNNSVAVVAKGSMILGRKKLTSHQLPHEIEKTDGYKIIKPVEW
ncbi:NYN domain-containing protein [Pseudoflavitalea sp. X16]|uniref:NYN domain-containing protein n=1 Tax=Paraflavitalea devenefica TaxID=2716334 RepID=UPI0014246DD1|nr:NYN domain-containing protein [Paraflavitalea devenefica]NII26043.1 NYN domain-containing protein [Paraflavitalea devenefica]